MLNLTVHGFISADLRAIEARPQPIDLIIDFAASFLERVRQRRIDTSKLLLQRIELSVESFSRVLECRGSFFAQVFLDDARNHMIRACKKIGEPEAVTLERSPRVLLDKSQACARQDWSHRPIQQAINLRSLGEISNLCRAAIVSNRRQQIILDDRAQRDVGAETIRLAQGPIRKFLGRVLSTVAFCSILSA